MSTDLLFSTVEAGGNWRIGVAVLNRPESLNALTLEMCRSLYRQLDQWEKDESIVLVVLTGSGDKAFCAGGDVRQLHASLSEAQPGDPWSNRHAREFFAEEYRLDYRIHNYTKPILCWASGIVMGGGVGLMMGASHRVASETTRFAMPETTIGVFPDVGGSWMFERLPAGMGMFLGLTGAQLGAADCRHLGLVDYVMYSAGWPALKQALQTISWTDDRHTNDVLLDRLLRSRSVSDTGSPGPLHKVYERIADLCDGPDFEAICHGIENWQDASNTWMARSAQTFVRASPGAARLAFATQKRARGLSLAEVFRMEYTVMLRCVAGNDFQEGVRALLIDKRKPPVWSPASIAEADRQWAESFFEPCWPDDIAHPLADLESSYRLQNPDYSDLAVSMR